MKKTIGYSMMVVQFFAQISPAFAGVFQADGQSVAQTAMEAGRVLQGSNSGDAARQVLTSQASGQAADAVTQWLNQSGRAAFGKRTILYGCVIAVGCTPSLYGVFRGIGINRIT